LASDSSLFIAIDYTKSSPALSGFAVNGLAQHSSILSRLNNICGVTNVIPCCFQLSWADWVFFHI